MTDLAMQLPIRAGFLEILTESDDAASDSVLAKVDCLDKSPNGHETSGAFLEALCHRYNCHADLINGCNALLGLLALLSHRDDVPPYLRQHLISGHRIDEARAAVAKAEAQS